VKRTFAILLLASCAHMNPSKFVPGPQGRLHVDDGGSGNGVPVLFVHGDGANLTQWRAQLDHLRSTRRAVAFDLRGMGLSDPAANGDYSAVAMVDDVEALAGALGLHRFVIVGHSFGGTVVAVYAAKHPERVAGLVLADASGNVKVDKAIADQLFSALRADKDSVVRQWFAPILKPSSEAVRNAVYTSVHNTPVDVFSTALQSLSTIDVGPLLQAYHGPKLAIVAKDIESPNSLHVQFPQVPVKKMTGVGHWLMMDKPDEFNRLLDEFLATLH
jgi:pimeloyl-ACP methyl ester carboxylesterase